MGSWNGYHLTIGPGNLEPAAVADELRAALPSPIERNADEVGLDADELVDDLDDDIWTADGTVHWNTGRRHQPISVIAGGVVSTLDVRGEWALAVTEHEAEAFGTGKLYAWIDGGYRLVDDYVGQFGRSGSDVVDYFEREWGVRGSTVTSIRDRADRTVRSVADREVSVPTDGDRPPTEPLVAAARDVTDRSVETRSAALSVFDDLEAVDRLLTALEESEPVTRRRAAAALVVLADERPAAIDPFAPPLYRALADDITRLPCAVAIRRLEPDVGTIAGALNADDADRRFAAMRYCELTSGPGVYEKRDPVPDRLVEPLCDAISDSSTRIRRAATGAFRWSVEAEDVSEPPVDATTPLLAATDDEDPRVRINATIAAAMLSFHHDADDHRFEAADAVVRAVTDPNPVVRSTVAAVLFPRTEAGHAVTFFGDGVPARLITGLTGVDDETLIPDRLRSVPEYVARSHPEMLAPVVDRLVTRGWDADGSSLARTAVETLAAERPELLTATVDDLRAAVEADRHADVAATVLERLRAADVDDATDATP